jgi:hypothetical protein
MNQKAFEVWVKVAALAFGPGAVVALAYDHDWGGPALRCFGVFVAAFCFIAAAYWLDSVGGKLGK